MSVPRNDTVPDHANFPVGKAGWLEGRGDPLYQGLLRWLGGVAHWLAPPGPAWRRYRVAPRANPAALRYELLRGIERQLQLPRRAASSWTAGQTTL